MAQTGSDSLDILSGCAYLAAMIDVQTKIAPADAAGISEAARILKDGGLVAFPTETVYGLGGDARSDRAVAEVVKRSLAAAGRSSRRSWPR